MDPIRFLEKLGDTCEIDPDRRSGQPVLPGTRFPVASILAELSEGVSIDEIAGSFDLDKQAIESFVMAVANAFDDHEVWK